MTNIKTNIRTSSVFEERAGLSFKAGDKVRVWQKIKEKDKIRLQAFEGIVIARKHGAEPGATFTVRGVYDGVGVERIFPLHSPNIDKIEILSRLKARRAKLYYLRDKAAKEIRKRMKVLRMPKEIDKEVSGEEKKEENSVFEENLETETVHAE